jgi:RNA polymerase primary sigma factor
MKKMTISGTTIDVPAALEQYKLSSNSANLKERDRAIFEERFGIKDGIAKTYAEVGKKFKISATRVEQLCARTLFKIGAYRPDA